MSDAFEFGPAREPGAPATTDLVQSAVLRYPANRAFLEGRRASPQVRQLQLHRFAALCGAMALLTLYAAARQGDSGAAGFALGLLLGAITLVVVDRLSRNSRSLRGARSQAARVVELDGGARHSGVRYRLLSEPDHAPAHRTRWPNRHEPQTGNLLAVVTSPKGEFVVL